MHNLIVSQADVETANVTREMRAQAADRGIRYFTHTDLYAVAEDFGADTRKMIAAGAFGLPASAALDCHANANATR
jgi:hypothetical protein